MHLELVNFRCYIEGSFTFNDKSLVLLKGEPGEGKSTIFEGLYWGLYGSLRNICHYLIPKTNQSKITLTIDHIAGLGRGVKVYRQNHPNRLILTIDQPLPAGSERVSYEDEVAQNIIITHFGTKNVWKSVSYIEQGRECALLNGSRQDRLTLLEEISFSTDNPRESLVKIDLELSKQRLEVRDTQSKFTAECELLQREISINYIPPNLSLTPEHEQQLITIVANLNQQYEQELEKDGKRHRISGNMSSLEANLIRTKKERKVYQQLALIKTSIKKKTIDGNETRKEIERLKKEKDKEETKQNRIVETVQRRLNRELQNLNNGYTTELEREKRRQQLNGAITHLQPVIRNMKGDFQQFNSAENDLTQQLKFSQAKVIQLEKEKSTIVEKIVGEERSYQEKIKDFERQLTRCREEKISNEQYVVQLTERQSLLSKNIDQITEQLNSSNQRLAQNTIDSKQLSIDIEKKERELGERGENGSKKHSASWPTMMEVGRVSQIEKERAQYVERAKSLSLSYDINLPRAIEGWEITLQRSQAEYQQLFNMDTLWGEQGKTIAAINSLLKSFSPGTAILPTNSATHSSSPTNPKVGINIQELADRIHGPLSSLSGVGQYMGRINRLIIEQREIITERKAAVKILACPKCGETLRLENGKLTSDPRQPSSHKEIEELKKEEEMLMALQVSLLSLANIWRSLVSDDRPLQEVPIQQLTEKQQYIERAKGYLQAIRGLKWIEPPQYSAAYLHSLVKLREKGEEMAQCEKVRNELINNMNSLRTNLQHYQRELASCQGNQNISAQRLEAILSQINQLEKRKSEKEEEMNKSLLSELRDKKRLSEEKIKLGQEQCYQLETKLKRRDDLLANIKREESKLTIYQIQLQALGSTLLHSIQENIDKVNRKLVNVQKQLDKEIIIGLEVKLGRKMEEYRNIEQEIYRLKMEEEQVIKLEKKIKDIGEELGKYQAQFSGLGHAQLAELKAEIGDANQKLGLVQNGLKLVRWRENLLRKQTSLDSKRLKLAALEEMRQLAEKVQYKCLEETILSINNAMNSVFNKVFDDDIHVELKLFRQIKSNKRTKPHVNCTIHYKGMAYEQPSALSGGEKNRLNLGMILALNLVSSSPILLLDECLNFLNTRLRGRCVSAVQNVINGKKTVLCISHEDNEACYDQIITVVTNSAITDTIYPLVDKTE